LHSSFAVLSFPGFSKQHNLLHYDKPIIQVLPAGTPSKRAKSKGSRNSQNLNQEANKEWLSHLPQTQEEVRRGSLWWKVSGLYAKLLGMLLVI
jgi:hypothetical protein